MTNREFAEQDNDFKDAYLRVQLPKSPHLSTGPGRQAGKWRRKKGLAYKEGR
jgi:hypothetical protein